MPLNSRKVRRKIVVESDDEEEQQAWVGREEECDEATHELTSTFDKASRWEGPELVPQDSATKDRQTDSIYEEKIKTFELVNTEYDEISKPVFSNGKTSSPQEKAENYQKKNPNSKSDPSFSLLTPKPTPEPEPEPTNDIATQAQILESPHSKPKIREDLNSTVIPVKYSENLSDISSNVILKSKSSTVPVKDVTGPAARIVLTYLVLTNFKSYAGRQEVGPFHTFFTSIVGPNGSGKSNVIDSLLFVFGFRASKMRQGKISALIHNSAAFPNLDYCEVSVHFQEVIDQPDASPAVVPNSDLIISRRAFKNNSSKYYLNGKESNFTTITTLLRDHGVDLDHKRFLILQGEVESIAQMKSKAANEHDDGLLEYLEDIIGTSKYKLPIEESATQVETLNEVCLEKKGRVQHVEREKNSLEDKRNKALAHIRYENELTTKQSALYQIYVNECSSNAKITEEAILLIQTQLDIELEKHRGNENEIKKLKNQYESEQKEFEIVEKDLQLIIKEMAKSDQERIKFEEKTKFLVDKRKKTEKCINDSRAAGMEAHLSIENFTTEIKSSIQEIHEMEKQLKFEKENLDLIRESLRGKTQVFSDQITEKQKSLEPWKEKINQNESAIAVAKSELAILHEKANIGLVTIEESKAKISSIKKEREAKTTELETCRVKRAKLEQDSNKLQSELDQLIADGPKLRFKLSDARQRADEARANLRNTQTQGNVLNGLMRLKESGRIDGFHGRLGNLGTIDQKYDVAISTGCSMLNHFVTDTVESGQKCIEYLRKTNLGRGNFICLDKIAVRDMSPVETPENVPRLFDLIKAKDEKFRPVFYHSLQNTLVAEDLIQANRIAYGTRRWRVVTLEGQLIDKSGTMSGGGNTVRKGLMSSKLSADTTKEQITKLEVDRDTLESDFQKIQNRQKEIEAQIRNQNDQIPQLDTKIQKIILELENFDKIIADVQRRIIEISKENHPSSSDDARIASLENKILKLDNEIEKLHGGSSSLEDEIKSLQEKIMQIGGEKLRLQKAKVDALKENIDVFGEKISTAEIHRAKAEKQKNKYEKSNIKAVKDLESTTADLLKLEEEIQNHCNDAQDYQSKVEEAQAILKVKKKELKSLKVDLDEKISVLNQIRVVEIEIRNKLEENLKILSENQHRLTYWTEKLGKLNLQKIDDLSQETEDHLQVLPEYTKDELTGMRKDTLKSEIAAIEEKIQNSNVDLGVLDEYRKRTEEYTMRNTDFENTVAERDVVKKRYDDLRQLRLQGFMEGFNTISQRLKEMYQMITMGGNAELELVDSLDPFSEGILFSVMPPKKSWKNISNLSGGEKTLSSLALVFALHHYKPTPLYVMDEIDAALDFRNVSIVANYIRERTKNAQFIVISLRNNMFELATRLVGVYKVNHMTKSVTIENRDYINGTV